MCHLPIAIVANPSSRRISDTKPDDRGMRASYPGKPRERSVTRPMPLVWWLRPVMRHDRVGEHSAVVWKPV